MTRSSGIQLVVLGAVLAGCSREAPPAVARLASTAPTGAMATARAVPVAVALGDGRVLAVGGSNAGVELAACDAYDPAAGMWSPAAPMSVPREYHSVTVLADGRVLVAGGINHVGSVYAEARDSAEIYDPATDTWTPAGPMGARRYWHGAVRLPDGRVLVAGGFGPTSPPSQLASAELYDPATNAWTPTASMIAGANELVLLQDGRALAAAYQVPLQIYDPVADQWIDAGPLPATNLFASPSFGVFVRMADGRVLQSGNAIGSGATWVWDPATGVWTAGAPLLQGRDEHRIVLLSDGTLLAVGGRGLTAALASIERYHPDTNTWTSEDPLAEARATPAVVELADGRVLVAGGRNTATGTWASIASAELVILGACQPPADPCGVAGKNCGSIPDGCGGFVDCGTCAAGSACSPSNVCVCTPTTCEAQGATCGAVANGCGGTLSCGTCPAGATCSSSNVCVCAPTTCAAQGKNCGTIADGCGGTLSCGTCPAGATCSSSNVCVCTPTTCAAQGKNCGTIADGCGGALSCGSCGTGYTCSTNVCTAPAGVPVRDATLRAPRCTEAGPACDSGALLVGRGPLGPEQNAPNTIGSSCADGIYGAFHQDESLDALRVTSVDGGPLTAGKAARLDATVWAYSAANRLDLYYAQDAAAPVWTFIATLVPTTSGAQTLSATFTLPRGALQAIRGTFRYGGNAGACTTGSFDDHDDLVFPVLVPPDTAPPVVNLSSPPNNATVRGIVSVGAIAADDVGVARVDFLLDGIVAYADMTAPYAWGWNTAAGTNGWHVVAARARDAAGNVSETPPVQVWVDNDKIAPTVSITAPSPGAVVSGSVLLAATASDGVGVAAVEFWVDGVKVASDATAPYEAVWVTDTWSAGLHTVTAVARDAAGNAATASVDVSVASPPPSDVAVYSPALGAPACNGAFASCDSGTLLVGRAMLGPELNQPNTLDTCVDGTSGAYHYDESLDRLRVSTLDGGPIAAFKTVRVEATVFPWSTGAYDVLDVYVTDVSGAPVWRFAGSVVPFGPGTQVLTVELTLTNAPRQAVRGVFRYLGTRSPCAGGSFDDVDDLAFDVAP